MAPNETGVAVTLVVGFTSSVELVDCVAAPHTTGGVSANDFEVDFTIWCFVRFAFDSSCGFGRQSGGHMATTSCKGATESFIMGFGV